MTINGVAKSQVAAAALFFTALALLVSLGAWQWQRGADKAAVETVIAKSPAHSITVAHAPPDLNWSALAYRQVRLQGAWHEQAVFLLANRTHHGRAGYEVFSPFQLERDRATLLINRGWVDAAAPLTLAELQVGLSASAAPTVVGGRLYLPQTGFTLGPAYSESGETGWPKIIQYLDLPALSATLGIALQPAAVALPAGHPAAFTPIWRARVVGSKRHFGYAAQWWGLAVTLLVFGFIWRRQATRSVAVSQKTASS